MYPIVDIAKITVENIPIILFFVIGNSSGSKVDSEEVLFFTSCGSFVKSSFDPQCEQNLASFSLGLLQLKQTNVPSLCLGIISLFFSSNLQKLFLY
jgi:hypothetical protein